MHYITGFKVKMVRLVDGNCQTLMPQMTILCLASITASNNNMVIITSFSQPPFCSPPIRQTQVLHHAEAFLLQ